MTSIIKNQIIKHLSAFARNLTPDQISVEVLRGKGELKNIELNEVVLTERLELPPWLKIVRAVCNRITVKVPWTKIKTHAVELDIDEIEVVLRLSASASTNLAKKSGNNNSHNGKSYDLAERVIEGLSINVQTLIIQFESDVFGGSLMFQRLFVESKSPQYTDVKDLHMTRVHDKSIHELLFFKQVSWQMCKVEASTLSKASDDSIAGNCALTGGKGARRNALNSPLRLIMSNGGKCKIAIKKSDLDCSVISARIEVHLEEILWVATLLQVRSAIDFYKHIQSLAKIAEKQKEANVFADSQLKPAATNSTTTKTDKTNPISVIFHKYDIPRSSHHLHITKIDLCLFDDSADEALPKDWCINNGAIQAVLHELRVDFYPSHQVFNADGRFADRSDWVKYHSLNSCAKLAEIQLTNSYEKLSKNMEQNLLDRFQRLWPGLHSQNVVIRIEDIVVQCVSEQSTKKDSIQQLFSPTKLRRSSDMPIVPTISFFHMEFTSYYFPASSTYTLPPDSSHLVMGPLEFLVDYRSIRWMVYVFENILNAFDEVGEQNGPQNSNFQPDFCAEFVEPTIVLHAPELTDDARLPKRFLLNFSNCSVSNFALPSNLLLGSGTLSDDAPFSAHSFALERMTENCFDFIRKKIDSLNGGFELPNLLNVDEFIAFAQKFCNMEEKVNSIGSIYRAMEDICLFVSTPSVSFTSDFGRNSYETPIASNVSLLAALALQPSLGVVLVRPRGDVDVVLDHFQYVRLIQLQTRITDLMDRIEADRHFFAERKAAANAIDDGKSNDMPLAVFCDLERVNVHLVLPTGPMPSPYELAWPLASMTMENASDSLMTPPMIAAGEILNNNDGVCDGIRVHKEAFETLSIANSQNSGGVKQAVVYAESVSSNPFEMSPRAAEAAESAKKMDNNVLSLEMAQKLRSSPSTSSLANVNVNGNIYNASGDYGRSISTVNVAQALGASPSTQSSSFGIVSPINVPHMRAAPTEFRPSNQQVAQLPVSGALHRAEYSTASLASADIGNSTNPFDDSVSISTTTCDYEQYLGDDADDSLMIGGFGGGAAGCNASEDAELAEEADAMDERNRWADVERKTLARRVNVLDATLVHIAALVAIGGDNENKVALKPDGVTPVRTKVGIVGNVSSVLVEERLSQICGDLYTTSNAVESRIQAAVGKQLTENSAKEVEFCAKLNDQKEALVQVNVDGGGKLIRLSDEVVTQLSPFTVNSELDEEPHNPPEIRMNISNFRVEVQNPKKKNPLRIRLGTSAISMNEGPSLLDSQFP